MAYQLGHRVRLATAIAKPRYAIMCVQKRPQQFKLHRAVLLVPKSYAELRAKVGPLCILISTVWP